MEFKTQIESRHWHQWLVFFGTLSIFFFLPKYIFLFSFGIAVVLVWPLVTTVEQIKGSKNTWRCPQCGNDAKGRYCGRCGAFVRSNPSYAGFRKRLAALIVDNSILLIPIGLSVYMEYGSHVTRFEWWFCCTLASLFENFYYIWYTSNYGQTPGKYLVGIRIVTLDFKAIGSAQAFKRASVDIALDLIRIGAMAVALTLVSEPAFGLMNHSERCHASEFWGSRPLPLYLDSIWILGEALVFFCNVKRRALHDYIAGSVVVDEKTLKRKISRKCRFRWGMK
jgi:uncharacterized RDD family membrane protein YckC